MKNTKKGFTLVELLVVIAIVAILATVAIIGYTSFTKKAEMSADQSAVTQMNTVLSGTPCANVDEVVAALIANKYNGDLTTYYSGYELAWLPTENVIVLIENDAVVYPENQVGKTGYVALNPLATDADSLTSGLANGKVHMNGNVAVEALTPNTAGEYELLLNGNTLNATGSIGSSTDGVNLVISDGVVNSTNERTGILAKAGATVELNNVQVYSATASNTLQCYGGTLILNNVTAAQHGVNEADWYNSAIQIINTIKEVEQADGKMKWTIYGEQAHTTVNSGMYTGDKAIQISAPGGNVTVNGGTLTGTSYVIQGDFTPQNYAVEDPTKTYESVITINGGNLNGNIKISAATELVINGGTFTGSKITYFDTTANKNVTVDLTVDSLAPYVTAGSTIVVNGVSFTK